MTFNVTEPVHPKSMPVMVPAWRMIFGYFMFDMPIHCRFKFFSPSFGVSQNFIAIAVVN